VRGGYEVPAVAIDDDSELDDDNDVDDEDGDDGSSFFNRDDNNEGKEFVTVLVACLRVERETR